MRARRGIYLVAMEWELTAKYFNAAIMDLSYNTARVLEAWELADAAQLDKHNGKQGGQGIKIMVLDPHR